MSDKWIRASDIATYIYCGRSWWLQRRQGVPSQHGRQLAAGRRYHQAHGRLRRRSELARRVGYALLFLVVAIITFQVLVNLGA